MDDKSYRMLQINVLCAVYIMDPPLETSTFYIRQYYPTSVLLLYRENHTL